MAFKTAGIRNTRHQRDGFSLLQTSIILMMAALVLVSLVPGGSAGDANQKTIDTIARLNKVEDGMQRFMQLQGRRPCPADGQYDVNNTNFGREAGSVVANSPLGSCVGGTPAAPMGADAGTGLIVAGMIPTKTLGLPDDYAFDAWGRRFTYEVDIRATNATSCYSLKTGGLQVKTKDPTGVVTYTDNVMYAYLSHGPGGYGAWPAQGSTMANRINTGISDADKRNNAGVNAAFLYNTTNFTNILYTKDRTSSFDDLVYYLENYKNTCCLGNACTNAGGFQGQGTTTNDTTGTKVITLDLNGDGLTDTVTCAPNASPGGLAGAGSVYVVFGSKNTFYGTALPFASLNGTNGVRIDGANAGDHLCSSMATGDVNGDNIHDLILGTSAYGSSKGAVYVVLGGIGAWPASCSISGLAGSSGGGNCLNGWRIDGETAGDLFGTSVASRDFNGDDYDDILIGAPVANTTGAAYLICGGGGPWPATVAASGLTGIPGAVPTCGIKMKPTSGVTEKFGGSVSMGNLNGDVYSDVVVGAPFATVGVQWEAGKVYSLCGGTGTYTTPIDMNGLLGSPGAAGTCGVVFNGVDHFHHAGTEVDAIGDVNGDGYADLAIGAPYSNALGRVDAGSTYIIYGKPTGFPATFDLNTVDHSTNGFRIDGVAGDTSGISVSTKCDVNGDGIRDIIIGAAKSSPLARANAGGVYVVFGSATALSTIDANTLDGYSGVKIYGAVAGDEAGTSVAAGDFYNYGICNILVGAPKKQIGANPSAGSVYTIMGTHDWTPTLDMNSAVP